MAKRELKTTEAMAVLTQARSQNLIDLSADPLYQELLQEERKCVIAKQIFVGVQVTVLPLLIYEFRFRQRLSLSIAIARSSLVGCFTLAMYAMCPPMRRYYVIMGDLARSHRKELKTIADKYIEENVS